MSKTVEVNSVTYTKPEHVQFIEDMGDEVQLYHGRNFWHGPAVRTDDVMDIMGLNTDVPCQTDQMGFGMIVYPRVSDPSLADAVENPTR